MNWTTDIPNAPGAYWFYGDAFLGASGSDFKVGYRWKPALHLVDVHQIQNGLAATTGGHFMQLRKFDPTQRGEGHLGYWAVAELPEPPEDTAGYSVVPEVTDVPQS